MAGLIALGATGALAQAPTPAQPQVQVPGPGGVPAVLPPDTTLQPNVPSGPTPTLSFGGFNPLRRPILSEPLGPWRIQPRAEARFTYDDNVRGAPRGRERGDGYASILPGINVTRQSARNTFVFDYSFEGRKYFDVESLDTTRHNLVEYSSSQLVEELLFLDTSAFIGQATLNQRNAASAVPGSQVSNTTEFYNYSFSPYMRNHFGGFADSELRYTFAQNAFSNSGGGAIPNSLTNQFAGTLNSGTDFNRLIWSVTGLHATTARENLSSTFVQPQFAGRNLNADAERSIGSVGAEYGITREFSVLGSGGYESIHDPTLRHNIDGGTWSAGFRVRPGPRTNLLATYGFREGQHFWAGNAVWDVDLDTRVTARYTEGLVTNDTLLRSTQGVLGVDEFGNFIDPNTRRQFDPTASLYSLTNVSFRQKRAEATFHAVRQNNYFDAIAYDEERTPQITRTSDDSTGFSASYARDLNPLTNAFVQFRYQHVRFKPDNRTDDNFGFTLGARYVLTETTDTYANYSYLVRESNRSINNLQDNVVFVGIRKFF